MINIFFKQLTIDWYKDFMKKNKAILEKECLKVETWSCAQSSRVCKKNTEENSVLCQILAKE